MPVFELIPSVRHARRKRPLFVGRAHERLSSSDKSLIARFWSSRNVSGKPAPARIALAVAIAIRPARGARRSLPRPPRTSLARLQRGEPVASRIPPLAPEMATTLPSTDMTPLSPTIRADYKTLCQAGLLAVRSTPRTTSRAPSHKLGARSISDARRTAVPSPSRSCLC
jgi:hypothetical protein